MFELVAICHRDRPRERAPFYPTHRRSDGARITLCRLKERGKELSRFVLELHHHARLDDKRREETPAFLKEQGVTLTSIDSPPTDAKHFAIMPADSRLAYLVRTGVTRKHA